MLIYSQQYLVINFQNITITSDIYPKSI